MRISFLFLLVFSAYCSTAQETVSFTDQGSLLGNISGFNYIDCAVDMNGDFLDDIVRVTTSNMHIDYQQPDGTFQQTVFPFNPINSPEWSICAGDLDGNGYNDLLLGAGDAVSFVLANTDGTAYVEKPMAGFIFSQRSTMADIDNDGDLDAFVCHDVDQSHPYRNDGNGNMQLDQTLIETADRPGNYSAIWTDYDNDGDIDLYITKCKGGAIPGDIDRTNLLYRNNGDGTFTEVGEQAGVADNAQSWSTVFEDFDNDGDFDAFVVNHDFKNRLYRNNGDGTFTDVIEQSGIDSNDLGAWENASGDFNNDGYMDIFSELTNNIYLGKGDLTFTGKLVLVNGSFVHPGGIGDFNNDGFLDVIRNSRLYINEGNNNNWLKINTVGRQSNPNGIGARVEIYGPWGRQIREVRSGQSFAPMSSLQVHFGLGQADSIEKVVVKWPSGIVSTIDNPAINTTLTVVEAACILPPVSIVVDGNTSLCPGDSVVLAAPQGFNYQWSNGDSTQAIAVYQPGMFSVEMTDTAGCLAVSNAISVSMIQDVAPTIEVDGFGAFCEGSSITLTASDGANHNWSNGLTGQTITVDESASLTVAVDAWCAQDQIASDTVNVTEVIAIPPVVTGVTITQGQSAELTATGDHLEWYDLPTGGTPLATGNTFTTDPLNQTTTFYVASKTIVSDELKDGGKPDNSGGGGLAQDNLFNYFDAWEPFTIVSVVVYAAAGLQQDTIYMVAGNGEVLQKKVVSLVAGQQTLELDFEVPQGTDFSLRSYEGRFFRNNFNVQFPYPIGDVGEITTTPLGNGFYYYFYQWKVKRPDLVCSSDRIPVTIEVTDAQEIFNEAGFGIFPNPAGETLFVRMQQRAETITVTDLRGKKVMEKITAGEGTEELTINDLAAGLYLLEIAADGKVFHTKFVKQ